MNQRVKELIEKIKKLEEELEKEINEARRQIGVTIERRVIRFDEEARKTHRKWRKGLYRYVADAGSLVIAVSPVIYAMVIPLVIADVAVTLYQHICFPVYGIKKVPRSDFVVIDRHHLDYLNVVEKFNCAYCGYANGVANYVREVAARTEERWCPIKHAEKVRFPHSKYHLFEDYGDAQAYRDRVERRAKEEREMK